MEVNRDTTPKSVDRRGSGLDNDVLYENLSPDALFKQIEDLKWIDAIYYMQNKAIEVSQWIVKRDSSNGKILWRRLPIHEACIRQPTTDIIQCLLAIDPKGVSEQDNSGRLPLHHACIHGACTDVIYQLLHEYPEASIVKDVWGKTPKECALSCVHFNKDDIIDAFVNKTQDEISTIASQINGYNQDPDTFETEVAPSYHENSAVTYLDNTSATLITKSTATVFEEEFAQAKITFAASLADAQSERDNAVERLRELACKIEELGTEADQQVAVSSEREAHLINEFECVSNRNTHMKFAFDKFEAQIASLEAVVETKNKAIKDLEEVFMNSELKLQEELENIKKVHKERTDRLTSDRTKLQTALSTLTTKFKDVQANISKYSEARAEACRKEYDEAITEHEKSLEEALEKVIFFQQEHSSLQEKHQKLCKDAEKQHLIDSGTIAVLQRENATLEKDSKSYERERKYIENEVYELSDYRDKAENRMDALEDLVQELESKLKEMRKSSEQYIESLDKTSSCLEEKNEMLDDMETEMQQMIEKQKFHDSEMYALQENINELTQDNVKYQIEIKELEKNHYTILEQQGTKLSKEYSLYDDNSISGISLSAKKQKDLLDGALAFISK